jgi:hypothetical protein
VGRLLEVEVELFGGGAKGSAIEFGLLKTCELET